MKKAIGRLQKLLATTPKPAPFILEAGVPERGMEEAISRAMHHLRLIDELAVMIHDQRFGSEAYRMETRPVYGDEVDPIEVQLTAMKDPHLLALVFTIANLQDHAQKGLAEMERLRQFIREGGDAEAVASPLARRTVAVPEFDVVEPSDPGIK